MSDHPMTHEELHALGIPHDHDLSRSRNPDYEYDYIARHDHGHNHDHDYDHNHDHDHDHNLSHHHSHHHGHGHTHSPAHIKRVSNRLARAIGHLESVKKMVENGRDCSEILIQLAAVRSAINNTGKVILRDHLEHCIVEAVEQNDKSSIDELNRAIEQFLK